MKRLVFPIAVIVAAVMTAVALAAPAPKTTGGIGYTAYTDVPRHLSFVAIQSTKETCGTFWNVTGVTTMTFRYLGIDYVHAASLTQNGQSLAGTGGYTGVPANTWVVNEGTGSTVIGNKLLLSISYTAPSSLVTPTQIVLSMDGDIAADGSISGTFTQTGGVAGTFTVPAGSATPYATYCGKGNAYYSDASGLWYFVNVKAVSVDGANAWFAGPVVAGNVGVGNWLFVKVYDGGEPGKLVDQAWGSFTDEISAVNGVTGHLAPGDGPFTITSGNLQVH